MNYFLAIVVAIMCSWLGLITLDIEKARKIHLFYSLGNCEDEKTVRLEKNKKYIIVLFIFLITLVCSLKIFMTISDQLNICKMITALLVLTGSACFDYREYRIPNIFPLILSISGIIFLVVGFLQQQDGAVSYIISCVFATVGCAVCLTVASALTNQGIGAGDIKLMSALALIGGIYLICGVLFFSAVICSILAVILLVFRKKTIKETLPFAPFIWMGFIITIFASIY